MSNYSDFFGVGSSGGGGGIPINSYTPFSVITTNNPTGYDATTGLYTHPDGTFWLQTGDQLAGVSSTYPDATYNVNVPTGATYTGFNFTVGGAVYSLEYKTDNGNIMINTTEYTTAGVATGFSITQVAGGTRNIGYSVTNQKYFGLSNNAFSGTYLVYEYDSAGNATGFSFDTATQAALAGATFDFALTVSSNENIYVAYGGANPAYVFEYSQAGVYTGFNFTLSNNFPRGIHHDGVNTWVQGSSNFFGIYDGSGTFVSNITTTSPNTFEYGITYDEANNFFYNGSVVGADPVFQFTLAGSPGKLVGDPTARTDTDTSQPLFIRLK